MEASQDFEDFELVGHIEKGRRLIEEQNLGILREGHSDPSQLALAAGEFAQQPVGEMLDTSDRKRRFDASIILFRGDAEKTLTRKSTKRNQLADDEAVWRFGPLRKHGELPGDLPRGELMDCLAVEVHRPAFRPHQSGEAAQQGRFAGAVWTDKRGDLLARYREAQVMNNFEPIVRQRQVFRGELNHCIRYGLKGEDLED